MIVMQEFEVYPDPEGGYAVEPCGLAGATEGDTYEEAVEMAVDWLRVHALAALERGAEFEGGGLGHAPSRGGTIVTVATNVELSDIPAVTAAEAAEMLGVSTARVAQLCRGGGVAPAGRACPRLSCCKKCNNCLRRKDVTGCGAGSNRHEKTPCGNLGGSARGMPSGK